MVQGISIGQSTLFNGTLKRTGSIFQFVARMEQDSSRIWCQAKANDKQITSQRGEMIIKRGWLFIMQLKFELFFYVKTYDVRRF